MELLKKVPLFSTLTEKELGMVYASGYTKIIKKERFIVKHGEKGDAMYLIFSGSVRLTLFNADGRTIVLSVLNAGDFFGELSLLDDKARSCTVIAATECELFILTRDLFYKLIREHPEMTFKILTALTKRLRRADDKIGSLALLDVYGRIVQVLYELASDIGVVTEEGIEMDKLPTQEELASIVGTTRESVSRIMPSIKKAGILKEGKGRKVILRKIIH